MSFDNLQWYFLWSDYILSRMAYGNITLHIYQLTHLSNCQSTISSFNFLEYHQCIIRKIYTIFFITQVVFLHKFCNVIQNHQCKFTYKYEKLELIFQQQPQQ